jgi:hypothetical protein
VEATSAEATDRAVDHSNARSHLTDSVVVARLNRRHAGAIDWSSLLTTSYLTSVSGTVLFASRCTKSCWSGPGRQTPGWEPSSLRRTLRVIPTIDCSGTLASEVEHR